MDIHDYLGVLRRGIVLIVLGLLIGLAGGFVAQTMEKPSYSATSRNLLTNKVAGDLSISQGRIASYVLVASSGLVLQPVIDELGLETSVDDLARQITVVAPPETVVIEITATASDPQAAADIANSVSTHFADVVADQLETTTGVTPTAPTPGPDGVVTPAPTPSPSKTKLPDGTVVTVAPPTAPVRVVNLEQAAVPSRPDASNGPLMLLVGGVLGLALGLVAASLREAADRRVRGPRDVAAVSEVPVVGAIVADRRIRTAPLTARAGSRTASAESFRALRAHIDHLRSRDGRRVFVITAADRDQGATTVAANLAVALANTGTSVAVVDADLRAPELSGLFGLADGRGLSEVLAGKAELDAALRGAGIPNLTVLPSGASAVNAGELLAGARMRAVLAELAERYEVVLLDTPAIARASDAAVLGALTGSTLLVVTQGGVTRPKLDDALALLEAGGSEPLGIVLTRTRRPVAGRMPVAPARPRAEERRAATRLEAPAALPRAEERGSVPLAEERAAGTRLEVPAPQTPAPQAPAPQTPVVEAPVLVVPPRPETSGAPEESAAPQPPISARVVVADGPSAEASGAIREAKPGQPAPRGELVRVRTAPTHLAGPLSTGGSGAAPRARSGSRRATAPAGANAGAPGASASSPAASAPVNPRVPRRVSQPVMPVPHERSLPKAKVPKVEAPELEVPEVEKPKVEKPTAPKPEVEAAQTPAAQTPAAKTRAPETPAAQTPETPAAKTPAAKSPAPAAKPAARKPVLGEEPAPASDLVTDVEHTIGTARALDFAFAALPTASEQRAGALVPEVDDSTPKYVERPIVVRPDPPRPASRFAPDPTRFGGGAYASAPAPKPGTQGARPEVTGTVVNTVSIKVQRDVVESATVPPPIRHILPRPGSTLPPKQVEAARPEPETVLVPVLRSPEPRDGDDDPTAETRAVPVAGSLLGEIGGLPRVEVRAARTAAVTDTAPNPEREARESYEQRARELERVAHERLMREQQRLAVDIREQLAHDKRELESVLDNRLEDTVLRPRDLD